MIHRAVDHWKDLMSLPFFSKNLPHVIIIIIIIDC